MGVKWLNLSEPFTFEIRLKKLSFNLTSVYPNSENLSYIDAEEIEPRQSISINPLPNLLTKYWISKRNLLVLFIFSN